MEKARTSLNARLAPAEKIFFTWLLRVFAAGTLVGSAWIDDAPPLELAAVLIAIYVAVRIVTQFGSLAAAAPFQNGALKTAFAVVAIVLLALAFPSVIIFVELVAESVAG